MPKQNPNWNQALQGFMPPGMQVPSPIFGFNPTQWLGPRTPEAGWGLHGGWSPPTQGTPVMSPRAFPGTTIQDHPKAVTPAQSPWQQALQGYGEGSGEAGGTKRGGREAPRQGGTTRGGQAFQGILQQMLMEMFGGMFGGQFGGQAPPRFGNPFLPGVSPERRPPQRRVGGAEV